MIRRAELGDTIHAPVAMHLEDLRRRAAAIREAGEAEARRIIAEAKAERQRLLTGAEERGFAQGLERGLAEGRAKGEAEAGARALAEHAQRLEETTRAWEEALAAFAARRDEMLDEARDDVLALALRIAQKVTHRTAAFDPGVAVEQLARVLALQARATALTVAVHPEDEPSVREALPRLVAALGQGAHATLETDPSLARGSCVVRSGNGGLIDASVDLQLDRIAADLLPGRRTLGAEETA